MLLVVGSTVMVTCCNALKNDCCRAAVKAPGAFGTSCGAAQFGATDAADKGGMGDATTFKDNGAGSITGACREESLISTLEHAARRSRGSYQKEETTC